MKKFSKFILVLILLALLGGVVYGGYYLYKKNADSNQKIEKLENEIAAIKSEDKKNAIIENNTTINESNNISTAVKEFSKDDLIASNGLKLGMFGDEVSQIIKDEPTEHTTTTEDATGDIVNSSRYDNIGLSLVYRSADGEGSLSDISWTKDNIKTARGLSIGATEKDILNAYPKNAILSNEDGIIVVGMPGDNPVYAVNNNGKLYFYINNGKVKKIAISYGHLN